MYCNNSYIIYIQPLIYFQESYDVKVDLLSRFVYLTQNIHVFMNNWNYLDRRLNVVFW